MLVVTGFFNNEKFFPDTPVVIPQNKKVIVTIEEETEKATDTSSLPPISRYFGILSADTYGDGITYQQKLRSEWDEDA